MSTPIRWFAVHQRGKRDVKWHRAAYLPGNIHGTWVARCGYTYNNEKARAKLSKRKYFSKKEACSRCWVPQGPRYIPF